MENASKALIIAGAILLSILIIALGMFILNKASSSADVSTALTENEIQAFNKKFENYAGEQLGSNVASLISVARSVKAAGKATKSDENIKISIALTMLTSSGSEASDGEVMSDGKYTYISNKLERSHKYYVKLYYDDTTGMVDGILISYKGKDTDFKLKKNDSGNYIRTSEGS